MAVTLINLEFRQPLSNNGLLGPKENICTGAHHNSIMLLLPSCTYSLLSSIYSMEACLMDKNKDVSPVLVLSPVQLRQRRRSGLTLPCKVKHWNVTSHPFLRLIVQQYLKTDKRKTHMISAVTSNHFAS